MENMESPPTAVVLMGVSGSGKSTVGRLLAGRFGWPFIDGDDYHSQANVDKMTRGQSLTDADRAPWLERLHGLIASHVSGGRSVIVSCSALKRSYRRQLRRGIEDFVFVYLKGDFELIGRRLGDREGHYMKTQMLSSQLETLEEPAGAIVISVDAEAESIVEEIAFTLEDRIHGDSS